MNSTKLENKKNHEQGAKFFVTNALLFFLANNVHQTLLIYVGWLVGSLLYCARHGRLCTHKVVQGFRRK